MTQQEIANHPGTGREVVARILGDFVKNKLIATARGKVTINNSNGLAALLTR